jgi:uncharacterized protein (TIGR02453 family)
VHQKCSTQRLYVPVFIAIHVFSADKTPIKPIWGIHQCKGKKSDHCGYYIHLETGQTACWQEESYCHAANILKALRQSIYENIDEYVSIVEDPSFKQYFPVIGESFLKTAPKGFPKDFKHIDYLKCKDFTCAYKVDDSFFMDANWLDKMEEVFVQLKRFSDFTNFTIDDLE